MEESGSSNRHCISAEVGRFQGPQETLGKQHRRKQERPVGIMGAVRAQGLSRLSSPRRWGEALDRPWRFQKAKKGPESFSHFCP